MIADDNDPRIRAANAPTTIDLFVEYRKDGTPFNEQVLVDQISENRYRVLASPGLLAGLAAGDEFELIPERPVPEFRVLRRGGNLSVQFFLPKPLARDCERFLLDRLRPLGGRLDGKDTTLLVWTVPISAGFSAIEQPLYEAEKLFPGSEWMYGNVYDKDGKTPLNWWK